MEKTAQEGAMKNLSNPRLLHLATHGFFIPINTSEITITDAFPSMNSVLGELDSFQNGEFRDMIKNILKNTTVKENALSWINHSENKINKFDTDPTLRTGLVFTGANTYLNAIEKPNMEDGILSAYEAIDLDLFNTELVVLSACETGSGSYKYQASEGVLGLQRGFQISGAKNLIMSLWETRDDIAQLFMTTFYDSWLNEGLSKKEAFKKTQLLIREDYPEPYLWGAFIMVEM